VKALGGEHSVKLAILVLDDIALANRTGDDFHGLYPWLMAGLAQPVQGVLERPVP
jgi:hypothetical protein